MIPMFVVPVAVDADVHDDCGAVDDDCDGVGGGYYSIGDYGKPAAAAVVVDAVGAAVPPAPGSIEMVVDPMRYNDDCYCRQQMSHYCCQFVFWQQSLRWPNTQPR